MHLLLDLDARPVIAHRGASGYAPENTLEAFRLAVELGAEAFELDVHLTADGVPVVIHDPTLHRTCGRPGRVAAMSWAALSGVEAGAGAVDRDGRAWAGRGVRIPTLDQVLEEFPDIPLLIELKEVRVQTAVAACLQRHGAEDRCVVASFHWEALRTFRRPPFLVGASRRDIAVLFVRAALRLPPGPAPCTCYAVPDRWRGLEVPGRRVIEAARAQGAPIHVWTVNDADLAMDLWRRGAAGMISNYPDVMVEARKAVSGTR